MSMKSLRLKATPLSVLLIMATSLVVAACQQRQAQRATPPEPTADVGALELPAVDEPVIQPSPEAEAAPPQTVENAVEEELAEAVFIVAGEAVLPVVADADICGWPIGSRTLEGRTEHGKARGAAATVKIKRGENRPIFKFDFSAVPENATVTQAILEFRVANGRPLNHVGVGTLHVPWVEGTGQGRDDDLEHGGACFMGPRGPYTRWREGQDDGDFNTVDGGNGGNATAVSRARSLGNNWLAVDIDPYVVHAAREHGQTLILTDETGIQDGPLTNAFISSRESGADAPRLKVKWEARVDTVPPKFSGPLVVETGPLAGTLIIRLPKAGDDGVEGAALGFKVQAGGRDLPRIDIPRPRRLRRAILVRDLPPGEPMRVEVTAFDKAGNTATIAANGVACPAFTMPLAQPRDVRTSVERSLPSPVSARRFSVKLADGLTLFDPISGGFAPKQTRADTDLPTAKKVLTAARGEILGLQALIALADGVNSLDRLAVSASDLTSPGKKPIPASSFEFHRQHYVKIGDNWTADILPVLGPGQTMSIPSQTGIEGQRMAGVYIDLLVDKATEPGTYSGSITVLAGGERAVCPVAVVVRDIVIPDELSFTIEMNAYGHSNDIKVFHETYRLLHKHRLAYNALGYGHSRPGTFTTPALNIDANPDLPGREAKVIDWDEYDRYYGPLFSGEIASDLPRKGEPAAHWYLPFHCGWPASLEGVNPHLWEGRVAPNQDQAAYKEWVNRYAMIDPLTAEHFDADWREANAAIARQFREHFATRGWSKTSMQVFNNHKYYFNSGSQSLWTMDEPQYIRDFRALDEQYAIVNEALAGEGITVSLRSDISRPQFVGDRMDRSLDLMVTVAGGGIELYPRLHEDMVICHDVNLWWYGGATNADSDPASYVALLLARWSGGCNGGLPAWTSFSGSNNWDQTNALRVVRYDMDTGMPVASFRMKAYRRAQQDMELLNLLSAQNGFNRWRVRDLATEEFPIKIVTVSTGPDDPGFATYEGLNVTNVSRLREKVVATLMAVRQ